MKNYFGKKVLGLVGLGMAVMLGCTACADWQTGKTDDDVNQSVNMENVNQSVNVEKETGDTQENQYVNSEDSDKSDSNFFGKQICREVLWSFPIVDLKCLLQ